jgi:hypothetical protein
LINCAIKELTASTAVFVLNKQKKNNQNFYIKTFVFYQSFAALANLSSCFLSCSANGRKFVRPK